MSQRTRGIVAKIGKSQFSFYVKLANDSRYYNTKYAPKFGEGADVGIEFEPKGDARANVKQFKVFAEGQPPQDLSKPQPQGGGGGGGKKDDSIVWQHSQEMAIRLLTAAAAAGALPALAGKDDEKFVQLQAYVDAATYKFYVDGIDPKASATFKREAELAGDSGGDAPKEDNWDDNGGGEGDAGGDWEGGWN